MIMLFQCHFLVGMFVRITFWAEIDWCSSKLTDRICYPVQRHTQLSSQSHLYQKYESSCDFDLLLACGNFLNFVLQCIQKAGNTSKKVGKIGFRPLLFLHFLKRRWNAENNGGGVYECCYICTYKKMAFAKILWPFYIREWFHLILHFDEYIWYMV